MSEAMGDESSGFAAASSSSSSAAPSGFSVKATTPMLTKFESKSNRVKGLSFHPTRTWILAALHNGEIQLWDYVMASLVNRFVDHEGPVRGVNFHQTQPLFVSGGDDYLIKVWDYKQRRCLFTLQGHLDYIRTVEFHSEIPWIVSSSDDQTVRIWNWQSRESISVLTGHNHYCMSASFHPKEDLVVSASLDQTVRVWDTSGLRKKLTTALTSAPSLQSQTNSLGNVVGAPVGEAVVKFVLEGHERGVNWASFHPTQPLIVTGADDRQVRLWRMNEQKAWQVGPMRGHTNNVSCVVFHPKFDFIISNSEDRSIRVWDLNKRTCLKTFRRDQDRFWILAAHPTRNLLAAGHDNGLLVFKLERERPAFDCGLDDTVYRAKDGFIRTSNQANGTDQSLCQISRDLSQNLKDSAQIRHLMHPLSLQVNKMNPQGVDLLVCGPGQFVELVQFATAKQEPSSRVFPGTCAVFCAKNRFAILDGEQILIKNFSGETVKKFAPQFQTDWMFPGGVSISGRVILRAEDRVTLFDLASQKVIHEVSASKIKSVSWAVNHVCLLSKRHVVICTRELEHCCTVSESVRVKSAIWLVDGSVLLYATLKHIKYMLPNGDIGVLRSLDEPVYMVRMASHEDKVLCVDRDGQMLSLSLDLTECRFKSALASGNYRAVMDMIKSQQLCGEAVVGYLEDKGYPEVALRFVKDDATSFSLAVECGQLAVARECAERLQDDFAWRRLGLEGLKLGDVKLAELCMQKTRDLAKLSFLYVTSGNLDNLGKMQVIAERAKDLDSRMHVALLRDDALERVKVLESVGQIALAYVTAKVNNLSSELARLDARVLEEKIQIEYEDFGAPLARPCPPLLGTRESWPLTDSITASSQAKMEKQQQLFQQPELVASEAQDEDNDELAEEGVSEPEENDALNVTTTDAWGADEDEIDLSDEELPVAAVATSAALKKRGNSSDEDESGEDGFFATVQRGVPPTAKWVASSTLASDHIAAGSFETAMKLLNRQIGITHFAPLKRSFLQIRASAQAYLVEPSPLSGVKVSVFPTRELGEFPLPIVSLASLRDGKLAACFDLFSKAKFAESLQEFRAMLQTIPLVVCSSTPETLELAQLLAYCREYIVAITLKLQSDLDSVDAKRQCELSAYLTRRDLQPAHLMLVCKVAMVKAFKLENYITAAHFAKRILALTGIDAERNAKLKSDAQKVLQKSEREGRNAMDLLYTQDQSFELDVVSLLPLASGSGKRCPFCQSTSAAQGQLCPVCDLSPIGVETLGLVSMTKRS